MNPATSTAYSVAATPIPTQKIGKIPVERFAKLSVLMPIYNERLTLEKIVERVLNAPISLDIELVAVDDCSQDGSWEMLQRLAARDPRIVPIRHDRNRGKGSAIRTAIQHMTGEVAVVQDADLEYDPCDYPRMLEPILSGKADAVFGSRFAGHSRRVLFFWHSVANRLLTLFSNMVNDLNLTDMETCYKMVRADTLKNLTLEAHTFTLEPELTTRLAQWGARIYEVPITYAGRTFQEGKKIRPIDGVKACWEIIRSRFFKTQFTSHSGFYILTAVAKANRYNRLLIGKINQYLGKRIMEAGAGIGNLSGFLLNRDRLLLVDHEPLYVARLQDRFGHLANTRVEQGDLIKDSDFDSWREERLDTVFCSNVVEHLEQDTAVLQRFHDVIVAGGHCIIIVPAEPKLYTQVDAELGHFRRYTREELVGKMESVGFEVVHTDQFNRLGAIGWWISGNIFRRRQLSPSQMIWFDRLLWLTRCMEILRFIPGMSLIVVGRKRGNSADKS